MKASFRTTTLVTVAGNIGQTMQRLSSLAILWFGAHLVMDGEIRKGGLNQHDAKKMKEETVKIRVFLVALLVAMAGRWAPVGPIGCLIPSGLLIPW